MKKIYLLFFVFSIWAIDEGKAQELHLRELQQGKEVSFRGLSIPNDSVAWISGSQGTVAKTVDGGENWEWLKVSDYEDKDFRSIQAFSDKKAIVVNAGSPAVVLLTEDGGISWQKVHSYDVEEIFYDGISFWDGQKGIIYGDPIHEKLQLLITENGGKSWDDISDQAAVQMQDGEAAFAASGTGIRALGNGLVWIGTGGIQSRLLFSYNYGTNWTSYKVPIEQGSASKGIFSIAINNNKKLIAVGGDYKQPKNNINVIQLSGNGTSWEAPKTRLSGYKSGVEFITDQLVIATGTSGTDYSTDEGVYWKRLEEEGFNVVRSSPSGKFVLMAGDKGRIFKVSY